MHEPHNMIRSAEPADFTSILELNAESVHFLSPLDLQGLVSLHSQAAYHKVVEVDGRVVAFLLAFREGAHYDSPNYIWFSERYASFLYIDRAVVHQEQRRKGHAAALYDDLIAFAAETGVVIITCEVDIQPPNTGSLLFHETYGFREVGTQWLSGGQKQVSLREKRLPTPGAR